MTSQPPSMPPDEARRIAARITERSRSNLAMAFVCLPKAQREAMNIFYAFCRIIDDIADEPDLPIPEKQARLNQWRSALDGGTGLPLEEAALCILLRQMVQSHGVDPAHYQELITGVEMDLDGRRYATFDDLRLYCHRVASVVGLVSIRLFGCRAPASREYALALGLAFQLTNIIRDVGRDYANGKRIYLPQDEMVRFGVTEADLASGVETPEFEALQQFQANRAARFYAEAMRFHTAADAKSLTAAEIMRAVYGTLLNRMRRDKFHSLSKTYRLPKATKVAMVFVAVSASWMNNPAPISVSSS